ncbi:MAG TPA: UDP-N-acetylmuramate--L-alanine ligase [bacterium]
MLEAGARVHFMGIGGIGMSGLAEICRARGLEVSGCDTGRGPQVEALAGKGVSVARGHHPRHLDGPVDLLVHTSAVPTQSPELCEAIARGVRTVSRGRLLAELSRDRRLIAVAGAHGKTTTSGMAAQICLEAGWDPTVVVGGVMRSLGTNAHAGQGRYLVAETDESDGSFLELSPHVAIITNIDREHLNYYQTFDRLIVAFQTFAGQLDPQGALIVSWDDPVIRTAFAGLHRLTYGLSSASDVTAERIRFVGHGSRFRARYRGRDLGGFQLQVPGAHNIANALGVMSMALTLEIPMVTVRDALGRYQGTQRRFQATRLPGDIVLVEDYAHHPSEIRATLASGALDGRHRLVVFQPHRYSRTQSLEQEFTRCFDRADGVIVTDIYPAFESPIPGVSGERLAALIRAQGHPWVHYVPKPDLTTYVRRVMSSGDTIYVLGAGDIGELCHDLAADVRPS